mgnify:CR=1 FL=1
MIPDDIKDRVLESTDLVALVSQTVKLRKSGPRYVGCCPFHGEKTPSFFVFPHTGTYKCFGCGDGGDAISFLQKRDGLPFVDAVKQLGKMCGVEVDEQEEDPQAKQKRMHKEALMVANEQVATFYAKQLAQSKEAQDYAYKRWGESYVKQKGLGFAPTQGKALTNLPIKREFLDELGLVNKGGYDQYQGRIVIPIRSRYGNVIGFTARSLGDEQPKYKNSADSILFHKSQVLFGIEDAWRQAAKADKFFLVEGAPDCMRMQSIGVLNCVAALGSSWNKEHFALIKKSASKVCFLPDDDPPKRGEFFGHGIAVILAAGKLAMECGLSVTVKEIPDHDKEHKQDPDSYYQNLNIFNAVDEVDFILWRAAKTFGTAQTTEEQRVVVREIAYLLTLVDDPTGVSMYIDRLSHITGKKSLWKEAISAEKKRIEEDEKRERGEAVDDLFKRFGFYVENGKYYSITEKGNAYNAQVAELKQRFVDGVSDFKTNEDAVELSELEHLRKVVQLYKKGSKERLAAEKEYQNKVFANRQKIIQRQQQIKDQLKEEFFGANADERLSQYDSSLAALQQVYAAEIRAAGDNAAEKLRIEEAFEKAKLALRKKYAIDSIGVTKNGLEKANDKLAAWLESDAGQAVKQSFSTVMNGMSEIFSGVSTLVQAELEKETAAINTRYSAEISAAEGNNYKVAKLEKEKQAALAKAKNEANKKMFAMQVIQAVAQTAQNAIAAYGSAAAIPLVGYIMAPVAAAMAVAAGMIQIAAIKKQQHASEAQGYAKGGFTPQGRVNEEVGVVHAGEWVASQKLLASPVARPLINALDYAQRTNTIGSLRADDVSRVMAPVIVPSQQQVNPIVVQPKSDAMTTAALAHSAATLAKVEKTMAKLNERLSEPFVTVNTVTGDKGIKQAQDEYEILMRNKSPKSKRS